MTGLARTRTHVSFPFAGDPWPTIAAWARAQGYQPRAPQSGDVKLFQKGTGFLTAPMRAQFTVGGGQVQLEAWVYTPLFTRITSLFLLPREMPIASGGFRGVVPRNMARKAVNALLAQVGAPAIS